MKKLLLTLMMSILGFITLIEGDITAENFNNNKFSSVDLSIRNIGESFIINSKDTIYFVNSFIKNDISNLTDDELFQEIEFGKVDFMLFGISNQLSDIEIDFTKKYKIGFNYSNCVIDPLTMSKAIKNNQRISKYLKKKYGDSWIDESPTLQFGIN